MNPDVTNVVLLVLVGLLVAGIVAVLLRLVGQSRRMDAEQRDNLLERQLTDMKAELGKVSDLVRTLEKERENKFGQLTSQLRLMNEQTSALSLTTQGLREALANTRVRGQWGERMAEDVLHLIGFVEGVNYVKQKSLEAGGARPDFTFILPREQSLNMDVKFPLDNYLKYVEAESPPEQERFRGYFLRDVRARLKEVVTRDYINAQQNTLGCVLMFIPNEQIYHFIHEHDSSLMDEALKSQVVLCSPMSLFAILVVIRQAVDNFTVEQTSNRIVAELGTFNKQWEQFTVALQRVGQRIEAAQKAFDTLNGQRRRGLERPLQRIEAIRQQRGLELSPEDDGDGGDIALGHLREGGVTAGGPTTFPSDSTVSGTEAERS